MSEIFAVILTYNRKELLKKSLDAVCSQTRPCDSVIVIDNASQDGTSQMLLESNYPGLKSYVLSENIGASGGFNAGFRLAYENGADFVWMMDDDVIPESDALQRLLDADEILRQKEIEHSFLLSTAFTENNHITNTPEVNPLKNKIGYDNWPEMAEHGLIPVRRASFVSILVPRSVLTQYGLPLAPMFIWGEDTEYTLRVSQEMPGFLVGKSRVQHVRQKSGNLSIIDEKNTTRVRFYRHYVRNNIFIAKKYFSTIRFLGVTWRFLNILVKLLCKAEFFKASVVIRGLMESITFNPVAESVSSPFESLRVRAVPIERLPSGNATPPDLGREQQPIPMIL